MQDPVLDHIRAIVRKHIPDSSFKLFVFGSRAVGSAKKYSDYDIGLEGNAPVPLGVLGEISADLEESDIPYHVDVVDFYEIDQVFRTIAFQKIQSL